MYRVERSHLACETDADCVAFIYPGNIHFLKEGINAGRPTRQGNALYGVVIHLTDQNRLQ
jgi:hypothetical protein